MGETETFALPMITCLYCGKEFQEDDYYEISSGDTLDCHYCEKEMDVVFADTVTYVEMRRKEQG